MKKIFILALLILSAFLTACGGGSGTSASLPGDGSGISGGGGEVGTTWTLRNSSTMKNLLGVTYGGGTFVAVGAEGTIVTSSDGVNWTRRDSGTRKALLSVTYGNGLFVAVGENGTILTSPDGANWTQQNSGTIRNLYSVTYGNGLFVAVGGSIVLTSPDGVNWTQPTSEAGGWTVTYGNGLFVAVVGDTGNIYTSPDGVN